MSERLDSRLRDPKVARDIRLVGDFIHIYCEDLHADRQRGELVSSGVLAGCYRRVPVLCDECAELAVYAEKRRAFCPYEPKPFCSECETHCYTARYRDHMRDVMRHAGPQVLRHRHPIQGVRHALAMRRAKKATV
ncbi:MAG: hypothetical protein Kow0056_12400 [Coriobacteriia bacterium]